ncbi:MAG: reductive dehalogenase domain-containing protein [candidate division Zixibacteria bacterium]|nr:reductive dehalogenase domain-containing protein [candidate division Zixibacteria bacterium]
MAIQIIYLFTGGAICFFFVLFAFSSADERKPRAVVISVVMLIITAATWFIVYLLFSGSVSVLSTAVLLVVFVLILYFIPSGPRRVLHVGPIDVRVDERDVIFAREEYSPGSDKHRQYYALRPDNRIIDDKLRGLPEFLKPGGRYYNPVRSRAVESMFTVIENLGYKVDGEVNNKRVESDPVEMTVKIKELAFGLGADDVGIASLNPMFVYSHVGRGPETWGSPIRNNHRYAIVFVLEMAYDSVEAAPGLSITEESSRQYLKGAQLSISLAKQIRNLGYPARAHIAGSNYQIMLSPVAHDAGLGELGRIGYLISPKYGARVRLGAVTTDLPLLPDKSITFGVQDFCEKCLKCAVNCPSGAIPKGTKSLVRGVDKWPMQVEKCLGYWRRIGTDCGLCMKVCPFSHPPTLVHNLVRAGTRRSSFARTISVWGDDLFYGRKHDYDRSTDDSTV